MNNKLLLFIFFFLIPFLHCFSQTTKDEEDVIANRWMAAITRNDIALLNSLISTDTLFPLLQEDDLTYWEVDFASIKDDLLSKIYYYCLNQNRKYASIELNLRYYYDNYRINSYYGEGDSSKIFGNDIYFIDISNIESSKKRVFITQDLLNNNRSFLDNNLNVLFHIIQKRKNIKSREAIRIIFASGSDDAEWGIQPTSALFFYKNIYNHPDFFSQKTDFDNCNPAKTLSQYVAVGETNKELLLYLLDMVGEKTVLELLPQFYPQKDDAEWDRDLAETVPSYKSEIVLFSKYPEMSKYSGHNLLHAAINSIDIELVKQLKETTLIYEKTSPIHAYFDQIYGDKPMLPLDLALYKEKQWTEEYNSGELHQGLPEKFRLDQIKKIIDLLQN